LQVKQPLVLNRQVDVFQDEDPPTKPKLWQEAPGATPLLALQEDRRLQRVDGRALDDAEAAHVPDFPQLEAEDAVGGGGEAGLLGPEAHALHELDVPERLGRRPARAVASATIVFWTALIRRDSTEESHPRRGTGL
jgi:hypothetical protein